MRTSKRLTTTLVAISAAALFGAACGDDDGGSPDANTNPDAPGADANTTPDATPAPTRSATIAVTEVDLTTPAVDALAIGGAAISISAEDLTTGGGTVAFGNPNDTIPCLVRHFTVGTDAAQLPFPSVDMGAVTIRNTSTVAEEAAILGVSPAQCSYVAAAKRYTCAIGAATAQAGAYVVPRAGAVALVFPAQTFPENIVGAYISVSGITAAEFNGVFPIVARQDANTIVVANSDATTVNGTPTPFADVAYTLLQGVGPVPGGRALDFLSDGTPAVEKVHVEVAASAELGFPAGVNVDVIPAGGGFTLNEECDGCAAPHEMPTSIEDADTETTLTFSCEPATQGGANSCGTIPTESGVLVGWAVSGSTTDADVTAEGVLPFDMPAPVERFATFTCTGFGDKITLSNAMLKAILGVNPTRIETRVLRINAARPPQVNVVAGHGYVGHTDVPQGKAN